MLEQREVDLIAAVEHPDPHQVLGPHEEEGDLWVRVFRPDAEAITVLPGDPSLPKLPLRRVHEAGFFEARFPGVTYPKDDRFRYRLEVRSADGSVALEQDPYAARPTLGEVDLHLAAEGRHWELYRILGAHVRELDGVSGTSFAVWAPNARRVSVVGDFNQWDGRRHAMRRMGGGFWEIFVPGLGEGALYKYEIKTAEGHITVKTDPLAQAMELRPATASRVYTSRYAFQDAAWMKARGEEESRKKPLAIYEVHAGSWRRVPGEGPPYEHGMRWMTYRELADHLVDYVVELGFTHVELMPVMEHPFDGSWGYQVAGYFAPTSRYGDPDDFRYLVDRFHQRGIGVILDWTPAHFPKDAWALGRFDGTALYEHLDPRLGEHREWNTYIFNYGRHEVRNFLIANALYWLDEFHIDGLRVDAVASMLYLDYAAQGPHDWVPNRYGGRENIEAIEFIRELSDRVHERCPGAILCAEESTAWPSVTHATYVGGLGFDFKWNMGWMHDTLDYFKHEPIHRAFHHHQLTFGLLYAFSEKFLLPLSHDEVVHLKRSLLSKMPGDHWQMLANLRALYGYMWAHPGKKLLFMGGEIGQFSEWSEKTELDWGLLSVPAHAGLKRLITDINALYRRRPALHELDDEHHGFRWIDCTDNMQSVISFVRYGEGAGDPMAPTGEHVVFVGNFTPVPRHAYRIGIPRRGAYVEALNTDAAEYGGSGVGNLGRVEVEDVPCHGFPQSVSLTLPPLAVLWLVPERAGEP
ncbi:glycogen branching protein [Sorangium cellulosum]|uniref:1,4-alpha-glucan branching enzyme GlgB n=1 Tax=Sorangium cellulosum TaxID=56 RepID=A0A4P2Q309_SORCE|nr:1,4-alpha-glucan branching protein GlgB [Sorangium cellulosum]AUX23705.1 glycogen branching protein [Sorangium cellulosum]